MLIVPSNLRGVILVSIVLAALVISFMWQNTKEKNEYVQITGKVTYLEKVYGKWPNGNMGKYRYLEIDAYEYPFEIFIGKDPGDFKPKFEEIDNLSIGDTITVFFYFSDETNMEGLDRTIQFIDKRNVPIFERGSKGKTLGIVMLSLCGALVLGAVILWRMNKIDF